MPDPAPATVTPSAAVTLADSERIFLLDRNYTHILSTHVTEACRVETQITTRLAQEGFVAAEGDDFWPQADSWLAQYRPYVVKDGVLRIPVVGLLINRFGYQIGRWITGYTYIRKAVERGISDANVRGIALVVDSPGGEAAGCFELSEFIASMRGKKPIRAFAADKALSGGYAIASAAKQIVATRSAFLGSIGVISVHMDWSGYLEKLGIEVTHVIAGKHKADGSPYQPLSKAAKESMQARVDKIWGVFVSTVAKNRRMDESKVRDTEAKVFDSDEAVAEGLADKIGSDEEELASYALEVGETGDGEMSNTNDKKEDVKPAASTETVSKADHDAAVKAATESGRREGVTSERQRFAAVMALPEAQGREKTAAKLAASTDSTVEQIKDILADIPLAKAASAAADESGRSDFHKAMDDSANPQVGDGKEDKNDDKGGPNKAAQIMSTYGKATGAKAA